MYQTFLISYLATFFAFVPWFSELFQLPKLILFLVLNIMWGFIVLFKIEKINFNKTVAWAFLFIIGILILNGLLSGNFMLSLGGDHPDYIGIIYAVNILFFSFLNSVFFSKQNNDLSNTTIFIGFFLILIGLLQFLGLNFLQINDDLFVGRIYSTVGSPNTLGLIAALCLLLSLSKKSYWKLLVIPFGVALILTESRSAMLALIGGIFVMALQYLNRKQQIITVCVCIFALIFGLFYFELTSLRSLFSRFYIWEATINFFIQNPLNFLVGSSYSSFNFNIGQNLNLEYYKYEPLIRYINSPHNVILAFLYSTGLIGLITTAYIAGKTMFLSKQNSNLPILCYLGVFGLLNNFFLETLIIFALFIIYECKDRLKKLYLLIALLILIPLNFYIIYSAINFEQKQKNIFANIINQEKLNIKVSELLEFKPYSKVAQDYFLTLGDADATSSLKAKKHLEKNLEFNIKKLNAEQLTYATNEMISAERFYPIEILLLANRTKELGLPMQTLQEYFIKKYPLEISPSSGQMYKDNLFVFKALEI